MGTSPSRVIEFFLTDWIHGHRIRLGAGEQLRSEPGTPGGGASLRGAGYTDDSLLLPYLSPLGWDNINLTGDTADSRASERR